MSWDTVRRGIDAVPQRDAGRSAKASASSGRRFHMTVLVIGPTGTVGRQLLPLLAE
jgi:hypothetical protein